MSFYANDEVVGAVTREVVCHGVNVLQIFRLANDEKEHVNKLLEFFAPPQGATVLDLGCGVGAVAKGMQETRPDLDFVLLNRSDAQLAMCPPHFRSVRADFEDLPGDLPPVDAAMALFAVGHGDLNRVMGEVSRVLPGGGVFFIYDMVCNSGNADELRDVWEYDVHSLGVFDRIAEANGFDLDNAAIPPLPFVEHMYKFVAAEDFARTFKGVQPVVLRYVKREN